MKDEDKPKAQLIDELVSLRQQVTELKASETEHKRAEKQILMANERLHYLLSSTSAVIYTAKTSGDYEATFISENVTRMVGYKPQKFLKKSSFWIDHIHPDDVERILSELLNIFEQERYTYEYRFRCKDGAYIWVRDEMKLVRDEKGEPLEIIGYWIDITTRKRVEESLRESEERYRDLINASPNAILVIQNRRFAFANSAGARIFGLSEPGQLVGRYAPDMIPPAYHELVIEWMKNMAAGKDNSPFEMELLRADGTTLSIESTSVPITLQGKPAALIISQDITERKRAEDQIQASLREKEALLREIHHRVKNNLQVVCALLDLQADAVKNEQVRTAFQESRNRIRSMAQIHEQLTYAENLAQVDMAAYVQKLVTSLRVAHGTNAVLIKIDVSDITLPFDAVSPCGLLINELVANALKHAFPSSSLSSPPVSTGRQAKGESNEIRITLRPLPGDENKMELTVSDNGVGLPSRIDLENSTSLGLTLVKLLIRQLKATLEVKREAGTTFKIVFAP